MECIFKKSYEAEKDLKYLLEIFRKKLNVNFLGVNVFDLLYYSLAWRIFPLIRDEIFYSKVKDKNIRDIFDKVKKREKLLKYKLILKIIRNLILFAIFLFLRKRKSSKILSLVYLKDFDFVYFTSSFGLFLKNRESFYFPKYIFFLKNSYSIYLDSRKICKKLFYNLPKKIRQKYYGILSYYLFYRIPFLFSYFNFFKKEFKRYEYFLTSEEVSKLMVIFRSIFKKFYCFQHGHVWTKGSIPMGDLGFFPIRSDKVFLWGEEFKKIFLERDVDEKKLDVVGSILHVKVFKKKKEFESESGRVLFITQQFVGVEDELIYLFSRFLEGFKLACKKREDLKLILKARKREDLKVYKILLKKFNIENFKILTENLIEEIQKAESVFSIYSSALYEAILFNRHIFCVFPENCIPFFPYKFFGIPYSDNPEKIGNFIISPFSFNFDISQFKNYIINVDDPEIVYVKIKRYIT
ncbi:MAG: hypothetical protein ABDH49_01560 [Candidatus Hydrothermales bacterium]